MRNAANASGRMVIPREDLIALAGIREVKAAVVNHKQAISEFSDAQRQTDALTGFAGFFCFWEYGIIKVDDRQGYRRIIF